MHPPTRSTKQFEFNFPDLDTLVLVEELEDEVVVRATRHTFSEKRIILFVRELAAEGFISDGYEKFSGFASQAWLKVRWMVDISWLAPDKAHLASARRFMLRLFASAAALWLGLMILLFLR